jgi:hypothetical protein
VRRLAKHAWRCVSFRFVRCMGRFLLSNCRHCGGAIFDAEDARGDTLARAGKASRATSGSARAGTRTLPPTCTDGRLITSRAVYTPLTPYMPDQVASWVRGEHVLSEPPTTWRRYSAGAQWGHMGMKKPSTATPAAPETEQRKQLPRQVSQATWHDAKEVRRAARHSAGRIGTPRSRRQRSRLRFKRASSSTAERLTRTTDVLAERHRLGAPVRVRKRVQRLTPTRQTAFRRFLHAVLPAFLDAVLPTRPAREHALRGRTRGAAQAPYNGPRDAAGPTRDQQCGALASTGCPRRLCACTLHRGRALAHAEGGAASREDGRQQMRRRVGRRSVLGVRPPCQPCS